jgi:hypothetical protein
MCMKFWYSKERTCHGILYACRPQHALVSTITFGYSKSKNGLLNTLHLPLAETDVTKVTGKFSFVRAPSVRKLFYDQTSSEATWYQRMRVTCTVVLLLMLVLKIVGQGPWSFTNEYQKTLHNLLGMFHNCRNSTEEFQFSLCFCLRHTLA